MTFELGADLNERGLVGRKQFIFLCLEGGDEFFILATLLLIKLGRL